MQSSKQVDHKDFLAAMSLGRNEQTGRYYYKEESDSPQNDEECYYDFTIMAFKSQKEALDSEMKRCIKLHFNLEKELQLFLDEVKKSMVRPLNAINRAVAGMITGRNKLILAKPGPTVKLTDPQFEYLKIRLIGLFQDSLENLGKKRENALKAVEQIETVARSLAKIPDLKERLDVQAGLFHTLDSVMNGIELSTHEDVLAEAADWNFDEKAIALAKLFKWKGFEQ